MYLNNKKHSLKTGEVTLYVNSKHTVEHQALGGIFVQTMGKIQLS